MQQATLNFNRPAANQAVPKLFSVVEHDGRFLVVKNAPSNTPLVIEDCRTKAFAEQCADNYNARRI